MVQVFILGAPLILRGRPLFYGAALVITQHIIMWRCGWTHITILNVGSMTPWSTQLVIRVLIIGRKGHVITIHRVVTLFFTLSFIR